MVVEPEPEVVNQHFHREEGAVAAVTELHDGMSEEGVQSCVHDQ